VEGLLLEADVEVDRRDFTVTVALAVAAGERLALFGPSGAGKTTALEMIAGLVPPRRGQVVLAGRILTRTAAPRLAVPPWRRGIGLLRQDPGLFPHLTVRQNLEYGAGRNPDRARTTSLAAELGIDRLLAERPARLSGGQAHRVALGRLLLSRCGALLLDEPYTGLDTSLRRALTDLVRSLAADAGVPVVLVAHELTEAQAFADRLAVLDAGQVLQDGPAGEVVRRPATRRVAELTGYLSFVPVAAAGDGAVAGVHPERVVPGAHPERGLVLSGQVKALHPAGASWEAGLAAGGPGLVWCRLPEAPGSHATVTVLDPPCFGADGALLPRSAQVQA
jgi:molybdate transport system ATP-binding protein